MSPGGERSRDCVINVLIEDEMFNKCKPSKAKQMFQQEEVITHFESLCNSDSAGNRTTQQLKAANTPLTQQTAQVPVGQECAVDINMSNACITSHVNCLQNEDSLQSAEPEKKTLPLHISGFVGHEMINILLDSGANGSCVNYSLVQGLDSDFKQTSACLITADKTKLDVLGEYNLCFKIKENTFRWPVYVVRGLSCAILLGNDFLSDREVILNYKTQTVSLTHKGKWLQLPMEGSWVQCSSASRRSSSVSIVHRHSAVPKVLTQGTLCTGIASTSLPTSLISQVSSTSNAATCQQGPVSTADQPSLRGVFPADPDGDVYDFGGNKLDISPDLTSAQRLAAKQLLHSYRDVFAKDDTDIEKADMPPYRIKVTSDEPIALPPYKLGPKERVEVDRQVDALLAAGVVEECQSPYAAPTFVVKKPGGKYRIVHNYQKVNEVIVSDKFPLPRIDTILDTLESANFYCQMDINQAFFAQPIVPEDRDYTSFITHKGLYRYTRLPQGMKTSPSGFQRSMNRIFAGQLYHGVVLYIDDLVAYGDKFEQQLKSLQMALDTLRSVNIKLKTSKCHFFYKEINLLGYKVTPDGIRPLEENVRAIMEFPRPSKVKDVRSFLGTCSFYRRFIERYSEIAHPLTQLTKKVAVESRSFEWLPEHEQSFQALKTALSSPPLLAHFRDNLETVVMTDSSRVGVGGVLSQFQEDGTLRPVAYVSRTLKNTENTWSISEIEILGVVFVCTHFRPLLLGRHFTVFNDHASLQYYKNIKNLSSRLNRLALKLIDFDFTIKHKPGTSMRVCDSLSRYPCKEEITDEGVAEEFQINLISQVNIHRLQLEDKYLAEIRGALLDPDSASNKFQRASRQYILKDDVLYFKSFERGISSHRLAVPAKLVPDILKAYHDDLTAGAHAGIAKTFHKISSRYHWPQVSGDVRAYVRSCAACQCRKADRRKPAGLLQPIIPPGPKPFTYVQFDYLGPLCKSNKKEYILVCTDVTTRFAIAKATEKADARTTVKFVLEDLIPRFGCVRQIQTDRGTHFTAGVMTQLCDALGIVYKHSTAYHPESQGLTERYNGTLLDMLHFYVNDSHSDWSKSVSMVTFVYNTSIQASTKYSPFYLVHGFDPVYPADLAFLPSQPDHDVLEALERLHQVREKAPEMLQRSQERQKDVYDKRHVHREFKVGDLVLLETEFTGRKGSKKLAARYRGPFEVVRKLSDLNYEINIQRNGKWTKDVVHLSRMKPFHVRKPVVRKGG